MRRDVRSGDHEQSTPLPARYPLLLTSTPLDERDGGPYPAIWPYRLCQEGYAWVDKNAVDSSATGLRFQAPPHDLPGLQCRSEDDGPWHGNPRKRQEPVQTPAFSSWWSCSEKVMVEAETERVSMASLSFHSDTLPLHLRPWGRALMLEGLAAEWRQGWRSNGQRQAPARTGDNSSRDWVSGFWPWARGFLPLLLWAPCWGQPW